MQNRNQLDDTLQQVTSYIQSHESDKLIARNDELSWEHEYQLRGDNPDTIHATTTRQREGQPATLVVTVKDADGNEVSRVVLSGLFVHREMVLGVILGIAEALESPYPGDL